VGKLQGRWLANHVRRGGTIVVINGSLDDDNAHLFNRGYLSILNPAFARGTFHNGGQYWTLHWVPATAGTEMENALTKDHNNVQGVLSANDGMAAAIVAALKRVGLAGIPVTGQDAQPDALGRILAGTQGMTVYKPLYEEANSAAVATNHILRNQPVSNFNQYYRTHVKVVHAILFSPVLITKSNVQRVVRDGFATWAQVCAGVGPAKPRCGK
jgi:D-xylose transport system substrate-binding protein